LKDHFIPSPLLPPPFFFFFLYMLKPGACFSMQIKEVGAHIANNKIMCFLVAQKTWNAFPEN